MFFHENGVLFRSPGLCLALETRDAARGRSSARASTPSSRSSPGESATFVLEQVPETYVPRQYSEEETREASSGR